MTKVCNLNNFSDL